MALSEARLCYNYYCYIIVIPFRCFLPALVRPGVCPIQITIQLFSECAHCPLSLNFSIKWHSQGCIPKNRITDRLHVCVRQNLVGRSACLTYILSLTFGLPRGGIHPLRFFRCHTFCIWNRILTF